MKKYKYIKIYLTPEEKEKIRKLSLLAGKSFSSFVRDCIFEKKDEIIKECIYYKKIYNELHKIRISLEKILKSIKSGDSFFESLILELVALLEDLEDLISKIEKKENKRAGEGAPAHK